MFHKLALTVPLHWRARWRNSPGTAGAKLGPHACHTEAQSRLALPVLAGHMKKPDLFCVRPVERTDRLGGGLQLDLAALLREISLRFRR
jgi:hypothetical protein